MLYKFVPSVRLRGFCYSMLCDVAAVGLTWLPAVCEKTSFFLSDEVYLGYGAAIPGKLLDQLAAWPPQRQPWRSQKTSIQKLQNGFDENNWPHLPLPPTQCL